MKISPKKLIVPLIIVIAGVSSCYPVGDLTVEDLDIAASLYDKTYYTPGTGVNKFEELKTFELIDTIVHIVGQGEDDNISRQYDDFVLEQVRLNMLKLGFTEDTDPDANSADVAITVSAMSSVHEVYYWYPYWGWYWGYGSYYPYSYPSSNITKSTNYYYYPWYPYNTYYTYQSGSVLLEMVDVARVNPDVEEIPVIWAGIANGVMADTQTNIKARLSKGIDQCFTQSPYLLKTGE